MVAQTQTQTKTQKTTAREILEKIVNEYEIQAKSLTKGLVELVQLVNKILKGTGITYRPFATIDNIPRVCWWDGNIRRCKWYEPEVFNGELVLRCNVTYSGEADWIQDYEETTEGLAKERKYEIIKEIAIWTLKLMKLVAKELEKRKDELKYTSEEINKLINALKA